MLITAENANTDLPPIGNRLLSKQKLIGGFYYLVAYFRVVNIKEYAKFAQKQAKLYGVA
jgi:hypothetical protein